MRDALQKVTLRQLQIFLVAAETLSFLRASKILGLTPPAVSMQMSRLAEGLGAPLFEKRGRQLVLTVAGEKLVPFAEQVSRTLREASETLDSLQGVERSTVNVAMVTTSRNFGPHLVARFQANHPESYLDITIANRRSVIEKLENNQVDLALMGRPPRRIEVDSEPFADHPYVVIASPTHPLARRRGIHPATLVEQAFLAREPGSGTRMVLERFFEERGLNLPRLQQMESNENIKQAVMANMGLAVISRHTIQLELQAGRIVELDVDGMPQLRTWFVLHMKNKHLSPAAQRFKDFVREQGPGFMEQFFAVGAPVNR